MIQETFKPSSYTKELIRLHQTEQGAWKSLHQTRLLTKLDILAAIEATRAKYRHEEQEPDPGIIHTTPNKNEFIEMGNLEEPYQVHKAREYFDRIGRESIERSLKAKEQTPAREYWRHQATLSLETAIGFIRAADILDTELRQMGFPNL